MPISRKLSSKRKKLSRQRSSEVVIKRRGGGTIISRRPVFSDDAKYVYLNCGYGVKVFSVKTGECVRCLEVKDDDGEIVSVLCYKGYPAVVTNTNKFISWNPKDCTVLRNLQLDMTIETVCDAFFVPHIKDRTKKCICVAYVDKLTLKVKIKFFDIKKGLHIPKYPLSGQMIAKKLVPHNISFGGTEEHPFIGAISPKYLNIFYLDNCHSKINIRPGDGRWWTCIAAHPTEDSLAVGDSTGRVVLMRNLISPRHVNSIFHWHTLPCADIAFTPAGSSMFTGGNENVLVRWNLENPHIRNYLPRLSSHIVHLAVSPDSQLVAVATLDNAVQIIGSGTNKLICVLQQLSWSVLGPSWCERFPAGLVFDPRTRCIMLNSRTGHLQFYSPQSETIVQNLDVTMQNVLTQERNKIIYNTEVTGCAISDDGGWLATVETRIDDRISIEIRLKFWQYLFKKRCFALNTSVELPHDVSLKDIQFKPGTGVPLLEETESLDYFVVTTGADKKARTWSPIPSDSVYKKGVIWQCQNTLHYKGFDCNCCDFSYDASLMAIGFGSALTLWDVNDNTLKKSLSQRNNEIKLTKFGKKDCCHLVVCATDSMILVWDLLNLTLSWTLQVGTFMLISDPLSCYMAIFTKHNKLLIINPEEKTPLYETNFTTKVEKCVFIPRDKPHFDEAPWLAFSQLYFIDQKQELSCFECKNENYSALSTEQPLIMDNEDPATAFGSLIAASERASVKTNNQEWKMGNVNGKEGTAAVAELLTAGAHTLPPVRYLCRSLLPSLIAYKERSRPGKNEEPEEPMDTQDSGNSSEEETLVIKKHVSLLKPLKDEEPTTAEEMASLFPEVSPDYEDEQSFYIDEGMVVES